MQSCRLPNLTAARFIKEKYFSSVSYGLPSAVKTSKFSNKADARTVESAFRTQLALGKVGIEPKREVTTFEKVIADFLKFSEVEHANQPEIYRRYDFACRTLKSFLEK